MGFGQPEHPSLPGPVQVAGGGKQVVEGDARRQGAVQGPLQGFRPELGEEQDPADPGLAHALGARQLGDGSARMEEFPVPPVGETDGVHDVRPRLRLGWQDEITAVGREDHALSIQAFDLDREREHGLAAPRLDNGGVGASRYRD